jgi:hypothetical protein
LLYDTTVYDRKIEEAAILVSQEVSSNERNMILMQSIYWTNPKVVIAFQELNYFLEQAFDLAFGSLFSVFTGMENDSRVDFERINIKFR